METRVPRKIFSVHGRVAPTSKVEWSTLRMQNMLGKKEFSKYFKDFGRENCRYTSILLFGASKLLYLYLIALRVLKELLVKLEFIIAWWNDVTQIEQRQLDL